MTQPLSIVVAADWAPIRAFEPIVPRRARGRLRRSAARSSAAPTCGSSTASAR
ncbi:MAG: hypothetical protein M0C28_06350 [Candidatus Moduliflexus flocculans]|nr:hypothetical protein [Candidatus Moduliflexus flocculans]